MSEQALEAHLERWERKYEQMKKLSERWRMLFGNADPKSTIGDFPHPEWGDEIAQLEAEVEKWKRRAESAEAVVAKIPQTIWENIADELHALEVVGGDDEAE